MCEIETVNFLVVLVWLIAIIVICIVIIIVHFTVRPYLLYRLYSPKRLVSQKINCPCCKVINTFYPWEPSPISSFDRRVMALGSLFLIIGIPVFLWFMRERVSGICGEVLSPFAMLFMGLYLISVVYLFVSIKGCDACLSRLRYGGLRTSLKTRARKNRP